MSNTNDSFTRSVALEKALQWSGKANLGADRVLEVAEKFRAFLAGEAPKAEVRAEDGRKLFRLPRLWDGYVYFRYQDSPVLYRSDAACGADAPGGISRINTTYQTEWLTVDGDELDTRNKLIGKDGYVQVSGSQAARVAANYMCGVKFE